MIIPISKLTIQYVKFRDAAAFKHIEDTALRLRCRFDVMQTYIYPHSCRASSLVSIKLFCFVM